MSPSPPTRIAISLDEAPAPKGESAPRGLVKVEGEADRRFAGWLGLLSALEFALGRRGADERGTDNRWVDVRVTGGSESREDASQVG